MSAGGTASNVQLGPGRLYVAPIGTTEPTSASAAMPSAWWSIGYTDQGTGFTTETTSEPVEVAEEIDPILYVNVRRLSAVAFAMAETTRRRLALALNVGAAAANDAQALDLPEPGDEVRVMLVWDSEEDPTTNGGADNIRWIYRKCYQSGSIEIPRRKAPAKSILAVNFRLEKPDGLAVARVFPNAAGLI